MRSTLLMALLALSSLVHAQEVPVKPGQEIVPVMDLRERNQVMTINGVEMVKATNIAQDLITWDADGTTYLVHGNYTGHKTMMQISSVGAAKQDVIWYRNWPLLLDKRGDLYAIDDSTEQDYLAKLQHWMTFKGFKEGWKLPALIGGATAVLQAALVNPNESLLYTTPLYFTTVYIIRALFDLRKSHMELNRGFNFFTKKIARNVESLTNHYHGTGEHDVLIRYKNGDAKGQPELMSLIDSNPGAHQHQHPHCLTFLMKKNLSGSGGL